MAGPRPLLLLAPAAPLGGAPPPAHQLQQPQPGSAAAGAALSGAYQHWPPARRCCCCLALLVSAAWTGLVVVPAPWRAFAPLLPASTAPRSPIASHPLSRPCLLDHRLLLLLQLSPPSLTHSLTRCTAWLTVAWLAGWLVVRGRPSSVSGSGPEFGLHRCSGHRAAPSLARPCSDGRGPWRGPDDVCRVLHGQRPGALHAQRPAQRR